MISNKGKFIVFLNTSLLGGKRGTGIPDFNSPVHLFEMKNQGKGKQCLPGFR